LPIAANARAATARPNAVKLPGGIFVSLCNFSHALPDDPIVHAGMPGGSHLHDFFGNRSTDASSTTASLLAATSTCRIAGDHAAYWAPGLFADGTRVTPNGMLAYYTRSTLAAPRALAQGLEIVAGGQGKVHYSCFSHGMPRGQRTTPSNCHERELLAIGVQFPDCWNGSDLDSADHRSHMAYSERGVCPSTHPVEVPRLTMWMLYPHQRAGAALTLASGAITTAHADFFNAWVDRDQQALNQYCLVGHRRCYKVMGRVLKHLALANHTSTR